MERRNGLFRFKNDKNCICSQIMMIMKKTFPWIVLLFLAVALLKVQPAQAQFHYGIKAGLNFANIGGHDNYDTEMRLGFHAGPFLAVPLTDVIALETGLYYSGKGYVIRDFFDGDRYDAYRYMVYLDIPAVAKYSVLPLVHVYIGPQASVLLDSFVKLDNESREQWGEDLRSLDLGLVLGAGITIPEGFTASFGFDLGLSPLFDHGNNKMYNRVLKFSVGYGF
jgi:hypothetical protein